MRILLQGGHRQLQARIVTANQSSILVYYCRPAEEWTLVMFDKMQHYLARLCWDNTVATCMAHIPRYMQMLI